MIERLRIKDFQNHRELTVDLDPHVTVFVGRNAAGKSAVLRSIKWVLTNRPLGTGMVGRWGGAAYCFAKLWVDGRTVARSRGKGINEFRLDGQVLKAPGQGVPQPVADLANVGEVNFQGQHDAPYWFLLSAAEVSRNLNEIINLSSIDAALAAAAADARRAKAVVDVSADRLRDATAEAAETVWAVAFHADVIHARDEFLKIEKLTQTRARFAEIVSGVSTAARGRSDAAGMILCVRRVVSAVGEVLDLRDRANMLDTIVQSIQMYRRSLRGALPSIAGLDRVRSEIAGLAARRRKLGTIVFGAENLRWEVDQCQEKIKETKARLGELAGGRCPACGQVLPTPSRS